MRRIALGLGCVGMAVFAVAFASAPYPLDGYEYTGIRRLQAYRMIRNGEMPGRYPFWPGGLLPSSAIRLRLQGANEAYDIGPETPRDSALQAAVEQLFRGRDPSYRIAILDITDPANPRYAAIKPDQGYVPGSVGKLLVMTALFNELRRLHPATVEGRAAVLRETRIVADRWVVPNSHEVPIVNGNFQSVTHRAIRIGDEFTLWEWVDHMVSPSSNAAGSVVWKEAMLMRAFGREYPVPLARADSFFDRTPKPELAALAARVIEEPLLALGLDTTQLKLRTFFTSGAGRIVPGGGSYSTPEALVRWLLKVEQGRVVDAWSSLEMKRLMYYTRRRYRFASSPALDSAAVYFKSGSLYRCRPEPGYQCGQYRGNAQNLMHSTAIVESPAESPRRVYLVSMMSDVLKINSAAEHQEIGTRLERLLRTLHP